MWLQLARLVLLAGGLTVSPAIAAQETSPKAQENPSEPQYEAFSGLILETSAEKITVSRSILGKPAEKRTFLIKPDTKIEGKLRVKAKVTVGYVSSDEGDIARLIVVRPQRR